MTTPEVTRVGETSRGVYFQLDLRTKGGMVAPILVKHCTRFDTMVCLTCVSADQCAHSRLVRRHLERASVEATAAVR